MKPEDEKFMDVLKQTHFFILESVKIYNVLHSIGFLYPLYQNRYGPDALDLAIFVEAHKTIEECFQMLLKRGKK